MVAARFGAPPQDRLYVLPEQGAAGPSLRTSRRSGCHHVRVSDDDVEIARWPAPGYYGAASALDSMGSVSAPLLAGFSLSITTIVLTTSDALRWPGITAAFSTFAALALIASVQFAFWAKQNVATPSDMREWWDDSDTPAGRPFRITELERYRKVYNAYSRRARLTYDLGIVALLASLGSALAPPTHANQPFLRWTSAGVVLIAVGVEVAWATATAAANFETWAGPFRKAAGWLVRRP